MSLYLTAILPPAGLAAEIDDLRKEIAEKYTVYAALKPPVHITLYRPVDMESALEGHLIKLLKPVSYLHAPMVQGLENFGSFNNKTLFVNCIKNPELHSLQRSTAAILNNYNIDPREPKGNTAFHPHITIAYRDVKPEVFVPMWDEFKNRKFKRSFTIDRFTLLKHDGKRWNVLAEYPLKKTEELKLF